MPLPDPQSPDSQCVTPPLATSPAPPAVRSFGLSDTGKVRPANEDRFLVAELARTLFVHQTNVPQSLTQHGRNRAHVFLVADGVGGHQAGEVASTLTVTSIEDYVLHLLSRFTNLQATDEQMVLQHFQKALQQTDARIQAEAADHPEWAGMGTTLTMAFVSGWLLFVIHAGDSRCYLLRAGKLWQLTQDHTWVGELARQGVIGPEEVHTHEFRHVITNLLGGEEAGVRVDVQKVVLQPGDTVLLCSDGLTDMLADERIADILKSETEPQAACERLVAEANEQGGRDNITAVVSRFEAV